MKRWSLSLFLTCQDMGLVHHRRGEGYSQVDHRHLQTSAFKRPRGQHAFPFLGVPSFWETPRTDAQDTTESGERESPSHPRGSGELVRHFEKDHWRSGPWASDWPRTGLQCRRERVWVWSQVKKGGAFMGAKFVYKVTANTKTQVIMLFIESAATTNCIEWVLNKTAKRRHLRYNIDTLNVVSIVCYVFFYSSVIVTLFCNACIKVACSSFTLNLKAFGMSISPPHPLKKVKVLACMSASGHYISPLIVYPYKRLPCRDLTQDLPDEPFLFLFCFFLKLNNTSITEY